MSWNEIKLKWAAMARRVRSDLPREDDNTVMASAVLPNLTEIRVPPQPDRPDA